MWIIKIRAQINEIESGHTIKKIADTKSSLFEKSKSLKYLLSIAV